jgi:hypothetical protein
MAALAESAGYILRIASAQWVDQVFDMAIYYSGLRRKWKPNTTVFFLHKTNKGDAIVGYGVIERTREKDEFSSDEQRECEKHAWNYAIEFKYVIRLRKPLLIKETILKHSKLRGRFFHGLRLDKDKVNTILTQAERLQKKQDQKS